MYYSIWQRKYNYALRAKVLCTILHLILEAHLDQRLPLVRLIYEALPQQSWCSLGRSKYLCLVPNRHIDRHDVASTTSQVDHAQHSYRQLSHCNDSATCVPSSSPRLKSCLIIVLVPSCCFEMGNIEQLLSPQEYNLLAKRAREPLQYAPRFSLQQNQALSYCIVMTGKRCNEVSKISLDRSLLQRICCYMGMVDAITDAA